MTLDVHESTCLHLTIILFFGSCACSFLVIPDEFPSVLHLIYGKIPPLRTGTDSRLGVGFRLGEHADFQILFELGPQKRTDPIGNDIDMKSKRTIETNNQRKSKSQIIVDKKQFEGKKPEEKRKAESLDTQSSNKQAEQKNSLGSEWLLRWRNELTKKSKEVISPLEIPVNVISKYADQMRVIEHSYGSNDENNGNLEALRTLFKNSTAIE